jgi:hypothetical protein
VAHDDVGAVPGAGAPLPQLTTKPCPHCRGRGVAKHFEAEEEYVPCGACWGLGEIDAQHG